MQIEQYAHSIIDMYVTQGMNTVQIAEAIGCTSSGVGRLLERHSVKRFHTPNELTLSPEQTARIISLYLSGETTTHIGSQFGISDGSVAKVLRQNGVTLRAAARRSKIKNHDFFHTIDTPEKAYFLGWMISDGSVVAAQSRTNRSPVISLEIKSSDRVILEMFAEALAADPECIGDFEKRHHSHIRFASSEMAKDLSVYGVVPRKTYSTFLPEIREDLMPHLIRGIFDGDGTVTIDQDGCRHFAFYGTKRLCEGIAEHLHMAIGLRRNAVSKSTCYHVWWGGVASARTFAEYVYHACGKYALERKKARFNF